MGYHKNQQLEQDELDDFVHALEMGHLNDPTDFDYAHRYDSIPCHYNVRMSRHPYNGRFIGMSEGFDYIWNDNTTVFHDGFNKPMVIKAAVVKAA